jgi:hypothetical protein
MQSQPGPPIVIPACSVPAPRCPTGSDFRAYVVHPIDGSCPNIVGRAGSWVAASGVVDSSATIVVTDPAFDPNAPFCVYAWEGPSKALIKDAGRICSIHPRGVFLGCSGDPPPSEETDAGGDQKASRPLGCDTCVRAAPSAI